MKKYIHVCVLNLEINFGVNIIFESKVHGLCIISLSFFKVYHMRQFEYQQWVCLSLYKYYLESLLMLPCHP